MNQGDLEGEESLDAKEGHVEEISMDDFMDTLIEALDTDADVFESDRQITSDPWFGKQKFSLGPNGVKFADPMDIFNDIYGNPGFGVPGGIGPYGPFGGRGPFGPMARVATEVMAREALAWVATEDMEKVALAREALGVMVVMEVMAWEGLEATEVMAGVPSEVMAWVAFGPLMASPTMDLALMVLKIMISSLLLVINNLYQLTPPRMVKSNSRSSLLDISHPITGISLDTSHLVTLGHLPMDSSLLTLKMQLLDPDLPGSGSALPWIIVSYGYLMITMYYL